MFRCVMILSVSFVALAGGLPLAKAHYGHDHKPAPVPDFSFDPADERVASTVWEEPLWYDADACSHAGQLWYAWLEFTPGKGDQIWVGTRAGQDWKSKSLITDQHGEYKSPTLTADSQGRIWLSYEALAQVRFLDQKLDQWDVFAVPLEKGTPAEPARRLSSPFGADINHAVAADQAGGLWFVWQSADNRRFNIFACRITKAGNDEMQVEEGFSLGAKGRNLSASFRGGSWHPSVAVDGQNNVYVAWDAYENGSFNVYLEIHRGNEVGKTWKVAESPAFEGRVKVVSAGREGVYLAWEEGERIGASRFAEFLLR